MAGNRGSTPPITLNQSPTANFTADSTSGVAPLEVSFNASSSSDSDGSIISYAWDFKNEYIGIGQTINLTFNSSGGYSVIPTVTDDKDALVLQAWSQPAACAARPCILDGVGYV